MKTSAEIYQKMVYETLMKQAPEGTKELLIAYYRVSSKQQKFGLGLEAQQKIVQDYAKANGSHILAEFTEVETGAMREITNRPELEKALAQAKQTGATLIVAKLDRLSRNVAFTSNLIESGVEFRAIDAPFASRLTIQIMSAFAENESRTIGDRMRAIFALKKAQGIPWPKHDHQWDAAWGRAHAPIARAAALKRWLVRSGPMWFIIHRWVKKGASGGWIADLLNRLGYRTTRGNLWTRPRIYEVYNAGCRYRKEKLFGPEEMKKWAMETRGDRGGGVPPPTSWRDMHRPRTPQPPAPPADSASA